MLPLKLPVTSTLGLLSLFLYSISETKEPVSMLPFLSYGFKHAKRQLINWSIFYYQHDSVVEFQNVWQELKTGIFQPWAWTDILSFVWVGLILSDLGLKQ